MVKIDLERRWMRGQRAGLEVYVKALPELGTPDHLPADLLLAEYEARQQCGAPADLAGFARRFPRQADELRRLVGAAPAEGRPSVPPDLLTPLPRHLAGSADSLPETFGRYRILRELGRGAMGTVYLAHDSQLDRSVALKVPRFSTADGPEVRQRFLSEARAAATIEHPNVCPVYDVGEIDGIPYLTMAYLQGQPLAHLLQRPTPLTQWQAAALVRQLTAPLQAAHERGIVHRDLKPSNILINQRGEPVILDFGLARRLRPDDVRLTQLGQPLGTPAYMSPEQVTGAVHRMGPGCDIYALGVILYQLLTGRLPFDGAVAEVLGQIVSQPPVPPSHHRPGLDPRLEAICLKALSKNVADRPASMRDLGTALTECLRCDPPPPVPRPRRKLPWLLAAGSAVAAVLLGLVLFGLPRSTGTIQIELEGARGEVEVQVDGDPLESAAVNEPLRLRPGKHHLFVTGEKIQPVSKSFTVAPGANPVLRVQLVPRADAPATPTPRRRHHDDDDDPDDD
jgi:hypothetical protein